MKKNNYYSGIKMSIILGLFILVQFLMIVVSVFFAGGGHGTSIPLIIFYGPLLILFQFKIFENSLISFLILFSILIGLFFLTYYRALTRKLLTRVAISYTLISIGILFYTELSGSGLGANLAIWIKILAILISSITVFIFWKILFLVSNKSNDLTKIKI